MFSLIGFLKRNKKKRPFCETPTYYPKLPYNDAPFKLKSKMVLRFPHYETYKEYLERKGYEL